MWTFSHYVLKILVCFLTRISMFAILCQDDTASSGQRSDNRLLLISFDGFRWNFLDRIATPNFDRIVREGVSVKFGLTNAFITKTLPNHFTMVTGLWIESHSIVGNFMYDPVLNGTLNLRNTSAMEDPAWFDMGAEPIWVTNQLRDGRSGVIMWPGAGAAIKNVRPNKYIPFRKGYNSTEIIDQMVEWFNDRENPINLGIIYIDEPDYCGHTHGPESDQMTQMIGTLDDVVGYLLERLSIQNLLDSTNIIITSDHGLISTPADKKIDLDKIIDPSSYDIAELSPIAAIWPKPGKMEKLFYNLTEAAKKNGHFTVYRKEDFPRHFHFTNNRRISPIHVVAHDSFSFTSAKHPYDEKGNHGYDNRLQDMHPFFVARGPAFKSGFKVDTFRSVDIYPLMCHLLGLVPAPNNGSMEIVGTLLTQAKTLIRTEF